MKDNEKKFTPETIKIIKNAVEIASTLSVESIVMDKFSLRGENKEMGIVLIMPTKDDIDLEFDAIGIGRVQLLKNRLNLFDNASLSFSLFDKGEDTDTVSAIFMKKDKTKLSFKCADPRFINAPKAINDPVHYRLKMTEQDAQILMKAVSTMSSETINFSVEDGGEVVVKISDKEGDMFSHEMGGSLSVDPDANGTFSKSYKSKTLRTIFSNFIKKDDSTILPISITKRGVMRLDVLGIGIYIFPER